MTDFSEYLDSLRRSLGTGKATEATHRPALIRLVEGFKPGIDATNEPTHTECGAPDVWISRRRFTLGYIETKDIGASLDEAQDSEQLKRYRRSLENLILTNYLQFRWYVDGELCDQAILGRCVSKEKAKLAEEDPARTERLLLQFVSHAPQTIKRPRDLALRMANLTHMIRDIIVESFRQSKASALLTDWRSAFAKVLIHDLDQPGKEGEFADMFAQTIAYGLFSARVLDHTPETFNRQEAQALIPKSNPFLRDFFYQITGPDLDSEPYATFVDDLAAVLEHTDMNAVLKDFGVERRTHDPVFHFYETFLAAYDKRLRKGRGVYYTPAPVVSYIVRSVDALLKSKFACRRGLADDSLVPKSEQTKAETQKSHRVLILDPACGTGTFLYEIVTLIRAQFMEANNAGLWAGYVRKSLLPRLFGFELLMAPYAIAHFKLALQLAGRDLLELQEKQWGCYLAENERLQIYLTNTLEDIHEFKGLDMVASWVAKETEAAGRVKRELPIMVVLGNPPYSGHSANKGPWIEDLVKDAYYWVDGKPLGERNPKWLQDDYVKFIRFGQWRIEQTGGGILAFISNNGYLDNPTFRGMRQSLMNSFTDIYILNLHGSLKKKEATPKGGKDENVFDIQQGVCIGLFVQERGTRRKCRMHYADIWGEREEKYDTLQKTDVSSTKWKSIAPRAPAYLFVPQDDELREEYELGWSISDAMPVSSPGIVTGQDDKTVGFSREEAKQLAGAAKLENTVVRSLLYRPFDSRFLVYDKRVVTRPRSKVMCHLLHQGNRGIITTRATKDEWDAFVTHTLCGHKSCAAYDINSVFPLYLNQGEGEIDFGNSSCQPNLASAFVHDIEGKLGLVLVVAAPSGQAKRKAGFFTPEDVFNYIYAVFHSPAYRKRYAEFLKMDFPRVPLTSSKKLFFDLAHLGAQLVLLHLVDFQGLEKVDPGFPKVWKDSVPPFPIAGGNVVDRTSWSTNRVWINKTQFFDGIAENVWSFHIGGYQVCEKWLKDRKGRELTHDEIEHYLKVVVALSETIRLMAEIDKVIDAQGGWPGAFLAPAK